MRFWYHNRSTGVDTAVFGPSHWNALGLWKIGGKIGEGIIRFWPPRTSILVFRPQTTVKASSNSNQNCDRRSDDRQTDRCQRSYNLCIICPIAIATGQIKLSVNVLKPFKDKEPSDKHQSWLVCLFSVFISCLSRAWQRGRERRGVEGQIHRQIFFLLTFVRGFDVGCSTTLGRALLSVSKEIDAPDKRI